MVYQQVFAQSSFRLFWIGFTASVLGDALSRVALTWFVYELTNSPEALGLLSLAYTGPVLFGGLLAGWLLDRFDRRKVLIIDNVIRGGVMALIPLLYALGVLQLWHIYLAAAVYGTLMMIALAGSPTVVPELVEEQHLATANALESLSYTFSAVIGPDVGGISDFPAIGAPNVVLLDAGSYFFFALLLLAMPAMKPTAHEANAPRYRLVDAVNLLLRNRVLLSTTLMYMCANIGMGALFVWMPILADQTLGGGSELYGTLLGALALGELASSALVGTLNLRIPLTRLICAAQFLSGVALLPMLFSLTTFTSLVSMVLLGFFSAPLTIWAQTLRMKIIPAALRGRTFALLRLLMQGTLPLGGTAGGFLLPLVTLPIMMGISSAFIGLPGLAGSRILWKEDPNDA